MNAPNSLKTIAVTAVLATSLIFTGCGESDPVETETGTETNWIRNRH